MQTKERSPIKRLASLAVACCVGAATVLWAGAGQEVLAAPPAPKDYTTLEGLAAYDLGHYNGILFGDWQAQTADNEGALAVAGNVNLPGKFSIAANGVHMVMGNYDPTTEGYPTLLLGAQKDSNTVSVSNQVDGIGHFVLRESAKDAFSAQMDKIMLDGGIHYVDDTLVDNFFAIARKSTNHIISLFENLNGPTLDPAVLAGGWYEPADEISDLSIYEVSIPALNAGKVAVVTLTGDRVHWKTPLFGSTFDDYDLVVFYAPDATQVEYDGMLTYLYEGQDGVIFKNSGNSNNPYWAEKLLMVYPKAENVIFGGSSSIGSIIAPHAKVEATNGGSHNGMLIADSLNQAGMFELHAYWISPYIKDALDDEEDPDPEPEPNPGQAQFTKVSTEGGTLPGAVFTLETKQDENWVVLRTGITSGAGGEIQIDKLEAGEYRLVETQAPEGHKALDAPVYFTMLVQDGETIQQTMDGKVPSIANEPEEKDPEPEPEPDPDGGLVIWKQDAISDRPIGGAVFDLYREVFEPELEADAEVRGSEADAAAEGVVASAVKAEGFTVLSADIAGETDEPEPEEAAGGEEAMDEPEAVEAPEESVPGDSEDSLAQADENDMEPDEAVSNEEEPVIVDGSVAAAGGRDDEELPIDGQEPSRDAALAPVDGIQGIDDAGEEQDDESNEDVEADTETGLEEDEQTRAAMADRLADWYDLEYGGRYWQLVEQDLVSDTDTGVIFASDTLEAGTALLLVETAAPDGYMLPEETDRYTIVAFAGDELAVAIPNTAETPVDPDPKPEPGDPGVALFWKTDSERADGIPDAQFRLEMLDENTGEYVILRDDILSDTEGDIKIEGLLPGRYRLIEEVAPNGYVLDETPKYFVMYEEGDETLQMDPDENIIENEPEETPVEPGPDPKPEPDPEPKPLYGQIRITKCDFDDNDIMLPGTVFTLEKYTLDNTGAEQQAMPLAAVVPLAADDVPGFLYDDENWEPYPDAASYTHTTDGSGEIIVTGLVAGIYRVEEVIPPDGYDLWGDGQDVIHFVMVEGTDVYGNPVLVVDSVYNNHLEMDNEVAFADRQVQGGEDPSSSSSQPDTTTSAPTTTGPSSVNDPSTSNPTTSQPTTTVPETPVPAAESEASTSAGGEETTSAGSTVRGSGATGSASAGSGATGSASAGSGATGSASAGSGANGRVYAGGAASGSASGASAYAGSAANATGGSAYRGAAGGSASAGSRGSTGAGGTKGTGSAGGKVAQTGDVGNGTLWVLLIVSFVAILAFAGMAVYRRTHRR